jgi:hypothetical protein
MIKMMATVALATALAQGAMADDLPDMLAPSFL